MRAKKLRTKVVGLVAAVMVVGAPLTAWAIDVAGGDLYYNGGQTDTIVYSEIGRKAGISRNYMVKATGKGRRRYIYQWIQVKLRLQRCKESLVGERNILL